jgi:hypothetical protein
VVTRFWLKPFGTANPRRPMADDWTDGRALDPFEMMSGPGNPETPPPLARGDRVLFHGVIYARIFADAEVLEDPEFTPESQWAPRWPWILACRLDAWLPRISDGPRSSAVAPQRVIGRIQRGSGWAELSEVDYEACRAALLARPGVRLRSR